MTKPARNQWRRKRLRLFQAMGGRCWYCDRLMDFEAATLDHLKPKAAGGSNSLSNLVLACQGCNETRAKGAFRKQTPQDFRKWARGQLHDQLPPVDANAQRRAKHAKRVMHKRAKTDPQWWRTGDGVNRPVDFGKGQSCCADLRPALPLRSYSGPPIGHQTL